MSICFGVIKVKTGALIQQCDINRKYTWQGIFSRLKEAHMQGTYQPATGSTPAVRCFILAA
jgi:hypothetical protein